MNNLSLLLYVAEFLPNLAVLLITVSVLGIILAVVLQICLYENNKITPETNKKFYNSLVILSFMLVAFVVIPSKQTILLIAASELGEESINSEYGQELISTIKEVLDTQLEALK